MLRDFPGSPVVKNLHANIGDIDSIPGWGISPKSHNSGIMASTSLWVTLGHLGPQACGDLERSCSRSRNTSWPGSSWVRLVNGVSGAALDLAGWCLTCGVPFMALMCKGIHGHLPLCCCKQLAPHA